MVVTDRSRSSDYARSLSKAGFGCNQSDIAALYQKWTGGSKYLE